MSKRLVALTLAAACFASPAGALAVRDCDRITDAAMNVVEPWETSSKTFYNGKVRVAWLDTGGEPACCSSHLLVLFYDQDTPENLVCKLVGAQGETGFAGIDFKSLTSRYDPAKGLLLSFGYTVFPPDGDGTTTTKGVARLRINVAGGTVTAE